MGNKMSWNQKIKDFAGLVRFSHTVFAMPFALASMLLAANGFPSFKVIIGILVCMVSARNAAMGFNRLVDAKWDAQNPRTAKRHIPAGVISEREATLFVIANAIFFVLGAWWLNNLAFWLSVPTLVILLSYSYWKRFHWGAHLFLGLSIGLSPLGAWVAVKGALGMPPVILALMLLFWIAGFDIIYATADREFDEEAGLQSIPVRFGEKNALRLAALFHVNFWIFMLALPSFYPLGQWWWMASILITGGLLFIHFFRSSDSLDRMNADFFLANTLISIVVLLAVSLEVF
jgi:4-hydroxybenzoate polyprenyltransferase